MRITDQQRESICRTVARHFGAGARVWLFGSRADDTRHGGDVDLYLEADRPAGKDPVMTRIQAGAELEQIFDGGKVDLLVYYRGDAEEPLHRIAKRQGKVL